MPLPSVLLFVGPEEGEKLAAIAEIREALKKEHGDGLEEHRFYAFETPPEDIVAILRNGSLFGSATFILYRAVENLKRKDELRALVEYGAEPTPGAVLILESVESSVAKDLEKAAGSRNKRVFWEMFDNQKQSWLQGYFRRHKVRIEPDAVELMLELVQNNTLDLRHEADRLIAFVGERVTVDDVDRFIYHGREESVFSLYDAVVEGDLDHALDIAAALSASTEAIQLVIGLSWQLDRLYQVCMLRSSGVADASLFDELSRLTGQRVTSKRVRKSLLAAASRYSLEECEAIKTLTGEVDALLRTVPAALHHGIVQQYLYGVIARRGAWSPQGRYGAVWPWSYPHFERRQDRV